MDPELLAESRALVATARAWLEERVDEGVETWVDAARGATASAADPTPADPPPDRTPLIPLERAPTPAAASSSPEPSLGGSPAPSLEAVRAELGDCQRCGLCAGRNQLVFGDGNPDAALMFIGEAPGEQEDLRGLPFVGRAGELLTAMIERGLEISRSEVYICNIVKCRPPGNRNPLPDEVARCRPFLDGQIAAVRPRVIVSLGKPAASLLLGREVAITRLRGSWQSYRGIPLMPTLHPAYVLRQYTPETRRLVWEDLKAALARTREDAT